MHVLNVGGFRFWVAVVCTLELVATTAHASGSKTRNTAVGEIAFSVQHGDGDAPWDIYVVRADGRWVIKKPTRGLQEDNPVWSPDGRHLAFEGWTIPGGANIGIYTMSANGSHRRRLAAGRTPQWSPDGRRIAYEGKGIDVMNADGSGKKHLASGSGPFWSPDGKQIAFTRSNGVYIVNSGGGGERRLTRTGDNEVGAWAPGDKIVFAHSAINSPRPRSGIYVINADGSGLRIVEATSDYDTPNIGGWSRDGKLIVYATGHGISTWQVSDGSIRRLQRRSADGNPTWSPDGRQIAFARNMLATTRRDGIWIMNRDGSGQRRIAVASIPHPYQGPNDYFAVTWAPR